MKAAPPYRFPVDQAAIITHPDFTAGHGLIAIVAPTLNPDFRHVGICAVVGDEWQFINGPSVVRANRVWQKLFRLSPDWECSTSKFLDKCHDWSIPVVSPDALIDLVTGGKDGEP